MTPDRWADIERVWHAVLARPEPTRADAVAELCAGDDALRREVESLLMHGAQASAAGFGAAAIGLVPDRASLLGRQLGPYTIHALLGRGGMGRGLSGARRHARARRRTQGPARVLAR